MTKRMLVEAVEFAAKWHGDSLDRGGDLALLHPLAVMLAMETDEEMIVAVLHDLVEDTAVYPDTIKDKFGDAVYDAVMALSRRTDVDGCGTKERYFDYIARVKKNALATKVKLADLAHNSSPARLVELPESERDVVRRYAKAREILLHDAGRSST